MPVDRDERFARFIHENAIACGGDWHGMLFSAIRRGAPEVAGRMEASRGYSFPELVDIVYSIVDDRILAERIEREEAIEWA